ncbi:MAG: type VI secretion system protein [Planctomycetota bacterium]|jgi:type VI secretion system protein
MKIRLLKRIKKWEEAGEVSASEVDINELLESMRDDVEKLLNTRKGTVLIDENYGLPDFTHLVNGYSAPDAEEIQRDLIYQLRQYETRLSAIALMPHENKKQVASIEFGLNAQFQHREQTQEFVVVLRFADNGSINVSL